MNVADRVRERGERLTPAERRVATVLVSNPQIVGFGTVADLAEAASAGAATVVRLANKLGYDGFVGLQADVQRDLTGQLRPAAERIREQRRGDEQDALRVHADVEHANVTTTLDGVDPAALTDVVTHLADERHHVLVLSGAASKGVALQFVTDLGQLRPGVALLDGNEVELLRTLALAGKSAVIVAIDVRRYDRWLVDTLRSARTKGTWVVSLTDSVLSPLASLADRSFVIAADSTGPFDSHVGTLALLDLFVVGAAGIDPDRASERLDRLEAAWRTADALTDS
jgi:DNA-binding MurR/RpiR family transcriptional regulator